MHISTYCEFNLLVRNSEFNVVSMSYFHVDSTSVCYLGVKAHMKMTTPNRLLALINMQADSFFFKKIKMSCSPALYV